MHKTLARTTYHMSHYTSGAGVPTRGTSHWGHPPRVERIRVHLRWVSRWTRRLLVVAGAQCPLTKPAVTAAEQQATTEPH